MHYLLPFLAGVAFGSTWGWVIFFVGFITVTALVENDKGFWAAFSIIFVSLALLFPKLDKIVSFVAHNPGKVALIILGYFVAGTAWSFVKWVLLLAERRERYNETKAKVLKNAGVTELTPELARTLINRLTTYEVVPQVKEHKSDILMWMTYWPFSGLWTLINDPVRRIFQWIFVGIKSSLQKISDRMFKTALADMELAKVQTEVNPKLTTENEFDHRHKNSSTTVPYSARRNCIQKGQYDQD